MSQPTDRSTRDQTLDGLTTEARAALKILPPIGDCERLERDLRAAVRELADVVRADMGYLPPGSWDRSLRDEALMRARDTLTGTLGDGLQSAARQVVALGERVEELRGIAGR